MIEHSRPWLTEEDRDAILSVLDSRMLAQGVRTEEFETRVSAWLACGPAGVAVSSGAAALALALRTLGVVAGDEVILPTYVCDSVRRAVLAVDATPVLADVGPLWVATVESYGARLTSRTRAVIVPHLYGLFADVRSFRALGVPIVEDCAQAIGEQGRTFEGDLAVLSFHPTKCITTGEGGMVLSHDESLARKARSHRLAPLSDLASALGLSQLARYEANLSRRAAIARIYLQALHGTLPDDVGTALTTRSMYYRFVTLGDDAFEDVAPRFADRGVLVRRGVNELLHRTAQEGDDWFPNATRLFRHTVSLPIYPSMTDEECLIVAETAAIALQGAVARS